MLKLLLRTAPCSASLVRPSVVAAVPRALHACVSLVSRLLVVANQALALTSSLNFYGQPDLHVPFMHGSMTGFPYSRTLATQPPSERASEIINSVPSSPGLVSKTGTVVLGTGLAAAAISQELYVVNEETVIAVGFLLIATFIGRVRLTGCPREKRRLI